MTLGTRRRRRHRHRSGTSHDTDRRLRLRCRPHRRLRDRSRGRPDDHGGRGLGDRNRARDHRRRSLAHRSGCGPRRDNRGSPRSGRGSGACLRLSGGRWGRGPRRGLDPGHAGRRRSRYGHWRRPNGLCNGGRLRLSCWDRGLSLCHDRCRLRWRGCRRLRLGLHHRGSWGQRLGLGLHNRGGRGGLRGLSGRLEGGGRHILPFDRRSDGALRQSACRDQRRRGEGQYCELLHRASPVRAHSNPGRRSGACPFLGRTRNTFQRAQPLSKQPCQSDTALDVFLVEPRLDRTVEVQHPQQPPLMHDRHH